MMSPRHRKLKVFILLAIAASLWPAVSTWASGHRTQEGGVAHQLALAAGEYAKDHEGKPPEQWKDLSTYADLKILVRNLPGTLEELYEFTLHHPPMAKPENGKVVLIRKKPFKDKGKQTDGRYVIWQAADGFFMDKWISEAEAKKLLSQTDAGSSKPESGD